MRVVLQRVSEASVSIDSKIISRIRRGILILLAITEEDTEKDIEWLVNKILNLRIFNDNEGKMNFSVAQVDGELMVVSQFTLYASTKKGNRPSYSKSAKPETAIPLYQKFIKRLNEISGRDIKTGEFGAMMNISLVNDGPVTIIMDTKEKE